MSEELGKSIEGFRTDAHIDEYVLDRDDVGTFSASDGSLTYARPDEASPTSVPLTEVDVIRFERNTTLHHMKFLGVCAVLLGLVLTVAPTANMYRYGLPATRTEALIHGFVYVFAIGAWLTAYDYLEVGNHDVIDLYICTADGTHVVCGSIDDPAFVHACEHLIDSNIPTTNQNSKLASEIA
ncbi:hypothetical protein [Halorubrum sp. BV1]|uniref:hypothetical protein n=1 Tax=Halorubrum sp. BV1 TaxID=1498500 RepID=UPI000679AC51|nr:hypothetical protein [Halorubrum sp. BV1]